MENKVLLGFKEMDITPLYNVETIGFSREDNISKGILHRLYAQISIWMLGGAKYCLLSIDNIGFSSDESNILRDEIANKLSINREHVMLCFSHTHSAPNITIEHEYFYYLRQQVLVGIEEAEQNLVPIKAVWGTTEADIGINRRNSNGLIDRRINILKVVDEGTDRLLLIILRVTAHANVLDRNNCLISSDFIGVTRESLEEQYSCKVMITQGASGNIKPKYSGSLDALDMMAYEIKKAVASCIDQLKPVNIKKLVMYSQTETYAADVPPIEKAKEISEEAKNENSIDGTNWLKEVEHLRNENIDQQQKDIEIQYFILNNGCFCGTSSEVMCELAINVSKTCKDELIYFGGYTNGCDGYLPTAEEYDRGGYEVLHSYLIYYMYHSIVMPLNRDTADRLVGHVIKHFKDRR